MASQKVTLGEATYEIRRTFTGTRPVSELIALRYFQGLPQKGNASFDRKPRKEV